MDEGRLPTLARLAAEGHGQPLGTSLPPQSPVAWSDFITGLDAGGHGIFDFIHRDPETMVPYLSTSRTEASGRILHLGGWQVPLSGGEVKLLRRGTPFWEVLEAAGVPTIRAHYPSMIHGFVSMDRIFGEAEDAIDQAAAALSEAFGK